MIALPLLLFLESVAEVLNSFAPPDIAVPTVSKEIPLESRPETSVPAQERGSPEEASIQTSGDKPNGEAATQELTGQTEEIGLVGTPVSQQEATADPAEASAALPVPEESVPSAETPIASSEGPQADKEAAQPQEAQTQESVVVTAEESASQEVKQISVEANAPGDEPDAVAEKSPDDPKPSAPGDEPEAVAEKSLDDPKPSASEDVIVNNEEGKATDSPKMAVEGPVLCLDAAQDEVLPGDVNVDVATQKENPDKEEPVILLSKAIQSKGTSKSEGPPLSTHHLSGWFILCE